MSFPEFEFLGKFDFEGSGTLWNAKIYRCLTCGSLVLSDDVAMHTKWEHAYNRMMDELTSYLIAKRSRSR